MEWGDFILKGGRFAFGSVQAVFPIITAHSRLFKQGDFMTVNQEATIKISKHTHHQLKILKAEGNFKSYDSLIQEVCRQWLGKDDWFFFDQEFAL